MKNHPAAIIQDFYRKGEINAEVVSTAIHNDTFNEESTDERIKNGVEILLDGDAMHSERYDEMCRFVGAKLLESCAQVCEYLAQEDV